jgi:crotonobetaine/carnitine-CoA ligase
VPSCPGTAPAPPTLAAALAVQARVRPHRLFLRAGHRSISYADADAAVAAYASGFRDAGIGPGDRVVLFMESGIEQVLVWLGLNRAGAVNVPVNTSLSGELLTRSLAMIRPAAVVFGAAAGTMLRRALNSAGCRDARLFADAPGQQDAGQQHTGQAPPGSRWLRDLLGSPGPAPHAVDPLAPATMLLTSGSTGVPKACVLSHHYLLRQAQIHVKYLRFRDDDVLFTPFPLFHIDGATLTVGAALVAGATAALSPRFSASGFWDEVRACDATVFNFMGATANILWKQPPRAADREHRVRLAWGVPMPACEPQWQARYGFPLIEVYGLTDAGLPAYQPLTEPRRKGSCGRVIEEYQVQIADEQGHSVPTGSVGEILIRSAETGLVMTEYFAMPGETAAAFRGGWFHTGDLGRLDAGNHLYFVARSKEVIRRRGENIAATDVEAGISSHPAVYESAVVATPSEVSEDDIRAFVTLRPGAALSERELIAHCREVLPRFMVPRYVEFVRDLPRTPTQKIERVRLAGLPLSTMTWDAELSGTASTRKALS